MPNVRKQKPSKRGAHSNIAALLEDVTVGKQQLRFGTGEKVFFQGTTADSIYFIQAGRIKITVVSAAGREAVLAMPGPGQFFGEGSLSGSPLRVSTAEALEPSTVFCIEKEAMMKALHDQPALSEEFVAQLLTRSIDLEEDLCDQLFNHSEKRLARVLLKLARLKQADLTVDVSAPALSHGTLADMVGTTRSRITYFMNRFRAKGLIDYSGRTLVIRSELLTDLLLHA